MDARPITSHIPAIFIQDRIATLDPLREIRRFDPCRGRGAQARWSRENAASEMQMKSII